MGLNGREPQILFEVSIHAQFLFEDHTTIVKLEQPVENKDFSTGFKWVHEIKGSERSGPFVFLDFRLFRAQDVHRKGGMACRLARLAGFEPATYGLEVRCSIHLSYRRAWFVASTAIGAESNSRFPPALSTSFSVPPVSHQPPFRSFFFCVFLGQVVKDQELER